MIKVETTVWLNEVKRLNGFSVLKCTHQNRKKDESGQWQTVSKDYIDVIVDDKRAGDFRHILEMEAPFRMELAGNLKVGTFEKRDGTTGVSLTVYPDEMMAIDGMKSASQEVMDVLNPDSAPF